MKLNSRGPIQCSITKQSNLRRLPSFLILRKKEKMVVALFLELHQPSPILVKVMANSVKNSAGFEPLLKSLYYSFIRFSAICSTRSNLDNFLSEILYGLWLRKIFGKTTSLKALRLAFKGLFSCYLQRSFPFKNLVWSATDHFPDLSTPQLGKLF